MKIMLWTVMKVVCQVSPNFGIEYLLLQGQDVSINALSGFCVLNITEAHETYTKI